MSGPAGQELAEQSPSEQSPSEQSPSAARGARPSLWPLLLVAAAGGWAGWRWLGPGTGARVSPAAPDAPLAAPGPECPADQLPDDGVCIPVPPAAERVAEVETRLELLPGRSPDYTRYVTPIAAYPATAPRDGLGLFVAAPRGIPVTTVSLEAQSGPTRRWVTPATAESPARLLTVHQVDRAGSLRTYVLVYDGVAFDPVAGISDVEVGTPLGRVAAGSGLTGLGLRVQQLRRGVRPEELSPERLLLEASSLACDARNVLPLKPAP